MNRRFALKILSARKKVKLSPDEKVGKTGYFLDPIGLFGYFSFGMGEMTKTQFLVYGGRDF